MAFRFDIQETFLKAIPRIARERIDRIVESLSEKPRPGAESIHEARKNLKSLRALLRLARGPIDREVRRRENVFFRDAGRSLSIVRDPQALLEALAYFRKQQRSHSGPATSKQQSVQAFVENFREKIEQNLVNGPPPAEVRKLVKELRVARRRVALWFQSAMLCPGNEWEIFVGAGFRRTYREGKILVWQFEMMSHEAADDVAWHELRKCAKALGYQLRLLKQIWPEMMNALVDEIDQLTDRLGDANDLSILRRKILDEPYDPSETQESGDARRFFLQSLDRRKENLHSEAFNLARLIYTERPGQFERRLAGYWQIWRSKNEVNVTRNSGKIGSEMVRRGPAERKAKPEVLASPS
jgi:CHAD domain-containing protein